MYRPRPISKPKRVFSPTISRKYYWGARQNVKILGHLAKTAGRALLRAARSRRAPARPVRRKSIRPQQQARRWGNRRQARALRRRRIFRRVAAAIRRARLQRSKRIERIRSRLGYNKRWLQAHRFAERAGRSLKVHAITYPTLRTLITKRRRKNRRLALRGRPRRRVKFGPSFSLKQSKAGLKNYLLLRAKSRRWQRKVKNQLYWKRWVHAANNGYFPFVITKTYQHVKIRNKLSPRARPMLDRNFSRKFISASRHIIGERSLRKYSKGRRTRRRLRLITAITAGTSTKRLKRKEKRTQQLRVVRFFTFEGPVRRATRQLRVAHRLAFLLAHRPEQSKIKLNKEEVKEPVFFTPKKVELHRTWPRGTADLQAQIREKTETSTPVLDYMRRRVQKALDADTVKSRTLALRPVRSNALVPYKRRLFAPQPRRCPRSLRLRRRNVLTRTKVRYIVKRRVKLLRRRTKRFYGRLLRRARAVRKGRLTMKALRRLVRRASRRYRLRSLAHSLLHIVKVVQRKKKRGPKPTRGAKARKSRKISKRKAAGRRRSVRKPPTASLLRKSRVVSLLRKQLLELKRFSATRAQSKELRRTNRRALRSRITRRKAFRKFEIMGRYKRRRYIWRNEEEREHLQPLAQKSRRSKRRLRRIIKDVIHWKKSLGYRQFLKRRARRLQRRKKRQTHLLKRKKRAWISRKVRPTTVTPERLAAAAAARTKAIVVARQRRRVRESAPKRRGRHQIRGRRRRRTRLKTHHLRIIRAKPKAFMPGPVSLLHTRRRVLALAGEFGRKQFMRSALTWSRRSAFRPAQLRHAAKLDRHARAALSQLRILARKYPERYAHRLPGRRFWRLYPKRITSRRQISQKRKRLGRFTRKLRKGWSRLKKFQWRYRTIRRLRQKLRKIFRAKSRTKRKNKKIRRPLLTVRRAVARWQFNERARPALLRLEAASLHVRSLQQTLRSVSTLLHRIVEKGLRRSRVRLKVRTSSTQRAVRNVQQLILRRNTYQVKLQRALRVPSSTVNLITPDIAVAVPTPPVEVVPTKAGPTLAAPQKQLAATSETTPTISQAPNLPSHD